MKKQRDTRFEKEVDEWLKNGHSPDDVKTLLQQITKAVVERALQGELAAHLGYAKHEPEGIHSGNSRNGATTKTVRGDFGEVELETPRDRNGEFEPRLVRKHQTRLDGWDEKILSLYARGMSTREIQGHFQEMYGAEVSPSLISDITDGVVDQAKAWQNRPLDAFYPVLFLDALFVKMRHEGRVENRAVYVALAINMEGQKEVLGIWTGAGEGAKFWLMVLTELRNRGVRDLYVVCVDGLRGFPQAIASIFPHAESPALHRSPDPEQRELRHMERLETVDRGPETDLPGGDGGSGGESNCGSLRRSGRNTRPLPSYGGAVGTSDAILLYAGGIT